MSIALPAPRPALVSLLLLTFACGGGADREPEVDLDAVAMAQGVELLYQKSDPYGALPRFREVLDRTPTHFGASYQLAVALDSAGLVSDARARWEQMLAIAEQIGDSSVVARARARLAEPDTAAQTALMRRGLHLMYAQDSAAAAMVPFREILRRNPTHYGATYQLATALDRTGRVSEARPVWVRMLGMAVSANDAKTAEVARERLR
ncbi:MAG: hypothetical protein KF689_07920 [Gemmatimonadaceae bacterium]|nr:hypothetical protein [Gemmatimonadaceae bacterium]MCW5827474.1 hypothetical protein [Gemmatimonadaceae bacterium]